MEDGMEENKWISVKDKIPKHNQTVLLAYKNSAGVIRIVIGVYIESFKEESWNEESYNEYCEKEDVYYLKEGWYEEIDNWGDLSSVFISEGDVSFWMELPSPPIIT